MARHHLLRASDADRNAVVDRLREAAGEGRLEPDELEERVAAALRARTYGELEWLVADLPAGAAARRRRHRSPARSAMLGAGTLAGVAVAVAAVALVVMLVVAVVALTAAWWVACIAFWIVCRAASRRHLRHTRTV